MVDPNGFVLEEMLLCLVCGSLMIFLILIAKKSETQVQQQIDEQLDRLHQQQDLRFYRIDDE